MSRETKIKIGVGLVSSVILYVVISSIRANVLFKKISEKIQSGGYTDTGLKSFTTWFEVGFHKNPGTNLNYIKQSEGKLKDWASTIEDSWGSWNDDEDAVYSVFTEVPDGVALSQLSEKYSKLYNSDLNDRLNDKLRDSEQLKIGDRLKNKPAFRVIQ
tara:strand:+ start:3794 stop:4267 length:474 start_codon:yes stop_codon:yes gene_type:complete